MKKINSKLKGKIGELEWVNFCKFHGLKNRRTAQFCGKSGDAADCIGLDFLHQEVKRVEKLDISKAYKQAKNDSKEGLVPIVAHRKNREEWKVTLLAEDFFKMYKAFLVKQNEF